MRDSKIYFLAAIIIFLLTSTLTAQTSSRNRALLRDNALMGSTNSIDMTVESIMDEERSARLEPIDEDIADAEKRLAAWQQLRDRLDELEMAAKLLYDPISTPFRNMLAESSNSSAVTATAARNAEVGEHRITVEQIAQADRLISRPVGMDETLSAGTFTITSGEESATVEFDGGSLSDLSRALRNQAESVIRTFLIRTGVNLQQMSIEAKETGLENSLSFDGDLAPLMDAGFLSPRAVQPEPEPVIENLLSSNEILSSSNETESIMPGDFNITEEWLVLEPSAEVHIHLPQIITIQDNVSIEVVAIMEEAENVLAFDFLNPESMTIGTIDEITINDWTIHGTPLIPVLPGTYEYSSSEVSELTLLGLVDPDGNIVSLYDLNDLLNEDQYLTIQGGRDVPAGTEIRSLAFFNATTDRITTVKEINILQETIPEVIVQTPEDGQPGSNYNMNYEQQAQDALFTINGIEVQYPDNYIEDLVEGLSIELHEPTSRPVTLGVDHDYDGIIEAFQNFTDRYNICMQYIFNVNQYRPMMTQEEKQREEDEFNAMPAEERQIATMLGERYIGVLASETLVEIIKSRLRSTMTNPYPTDLDNQLMFLTQAGWRNPDYRDTNESINDNLIAQYLELETEVLREQLIMNFDEVQQLFYSDTDGDIIYDNGCAYIMASMTGDFTAERLTNQMGNVMSGPIKSLTQGLRDRIEDLYELRERAEEDLAMRAEEIRQELYEIDQAQQYMDQQLQRFQNFGSGLNSQQQ